jgi:hypothetical protein
MRFSRRRLVGSLMLLTLFRAGAVRAQEIQVEPAFSNTLLASAALPEIVLTQTETGFDAPREVAAGRYLVSLTSLPGWSAYLDLVQPPAGLAEADAGEQFLSAARYDTPVPGWTYGGGTYADDGGTAWVVFDLAPGEWTWGLSAQPSEQGAEETPYLLPLSVTVGTPAAFNGVSTLNPTVDVKMTEFVFGGLEDATLPAGPQVWRFSNVGGHSHHMVLFRTPQLVTADDVDALVAAFLGATPTPPPQWWLEAVWVGYAAILSPDHAFMTEFDLAPGSYIALCFIIDPATGLPHLAEGMAQAFTVAEVGTPVA